MAAFGASLDTLDGWVFDRLAALVSPHVVAAGQHLWSRGKPVEFLYFMRQGRVQARRAGAPPGTVDGRWFLGGFEGHASRPAHRDLVALTDFDALRIRRRSWLELLEDNFELARRTVIASATAVARLDERLPADLSHPQASPVPAGLAEQSLAPLSLVDRIAFLSEVPLARGPGMQALADVAGISNEIRLEKDDVLFAKGATHEHHYIVVDGELTADRASPEVHRRYGPRELVAGAAALSGGARHFIARARTPARLLAIPHEAWFDLMEEHFELVDSILGTLAVERERLLERLTADAAPDGLLFSLTGVGGPEVVAGGARS